MSDTLDALNSALAKPEPPKPDPAAIVEQMVAEHRASEDEEAARDINPFDLINKGIVKIQTAAEANAVARLLVNADRRLADTKAIEAKRVARELSRATRLHGIFENALATWTRAQLQGKKKRSLLLENADLQLRKRGAHNETSSEADLTAWAERDCVEAVSYRPVVSIEVVKQYEAKTGKPAPGRIHVEESETFRVAIPKTEEE